MPDEPMVAAFAGPYADGPPEEALRVHRPPLNRFGPGEAVRIVVVLAVLGGALLLGLARWVLCWPVRRAIGRAAPGWDRVLARAAVGAFGRLGPVYIKLGQFIASSPGLFPEVLSNAARRCLDDMAPFRTQRARRLVARELGQPLERLFREFGEVPVSAASIAQVHSCVLPDGRPAVLKLRRPRVGRRIVTDLRGLHLIARVLDRHLSLVRMTSAVAVVERLYESNCQELNFAREASLQERFRASLASFGDNKGVTVPEVYWAYCAPSVICMQRLFGTPMDNPEELAAKGIDGELPMRRGVKAWLEAAILHGPFHGDTHAGNLWILDDGRMAFLDFGITGELDESWRELLRDVLYTMMFDRNFERVARGLRRCGVLTPTAGTDTQLGWVLRALFAPALDAPISRLNTRKVMESVLSVARQYGGQHPPEMTLFVKQLLYFERYSGALAPNWVLGADPFLVRNIFPEAAAARAEQLGLVLPD